MRILFYNLDNSSGGNKYFGAKVLEWLHETYTSDLIPIKENYIDVCSIEKHYTELSRDLMALKPDVVIINDLNRNVLIATYHYKLYYPNCKMMFLTRDWTYIVERENDLCIKNFLDGCSFILTLNYAPDKISPFGVPMDNLLFPIDYLEFNIATPWSQRKNKFVYVGDINSSKFSEEFIVLLKEDNTDVKIDCYGTMSENVEYNNLFNSCNALSYNGTLAQAGVANVLNQYKYFVLPNAFSDKSNISLMQAMFCGVVPVVMNNRLSDTFNYKWIDWADGLYLGTNTAMDFFSNFKKLINVDIENGEQYSELISNKMQQRSNYTKIKQLIINKINNLMG